MFLSIKSVIDYQACQVALRDKIKKLFTRRKVELRKESYKYKEIIFIGGYYEYLNEIRVIKDNLKLLRN